MSKEKGKLQTITGPEALSLFRGLPIRAKIHPKIKPKIKPKKQPKKKAGIFDGCESQLEFIALCQIREAGIPEPEKQYKFSKDRKYRFDFVWLNIKVALEIQGGTAQKPFKVIVKGKSRWVQDVTAHLSMKGYESDRKKIFLAQKEGWIVLEVTSGMINRE